jgi:hypothetical protein
MSEHNPTISDQLERPRLRGVSRSDSQRPLRRWSVAELIARSLVRPENDADVSERWGTRRASSAG